jgi:hypothetical protein
LKREAPYLFLGGGMIQRDPTGTADRVYGHWLWEDELDQAILRGGFGHLNRGVVRGVDFGHAGGSSMLLVPGGFRDKGVRLFYVNESLNFDPDCDHLPGDVWMEALNLNTLLPLEASFAASETSGVAPLAVDFTDLSPGPIEQWEWKFGDGGTSTEINPQHTYTTPGTYTVSLEVLGHGKGDVAVREDLIVVQ